MKKTKVNAKYEPKGKDSKLINEVIKRMALDISIGDWTCIDELLHFVPRKNLIYFLPEDLWKHFKKKGEKI